ncbi:hypothetical protein PUNSTDRAFT_139722 [Punctularia strigosozonata HHB-11173 SS5]|uniref:Uncharacterized protein n=1 Tax=Punctularia strigosozonata (strain HHB-11173) TaxID=741275 RepID=R7S0E7_PUNST|nr:uncharacterized protein PUNSTDRAFT_139722 [Punctularia strigosozonata HHB-11173 SS5]EIN03257.1 hypothetical protein PUNSTDRAFT_139722 [Punctularia strigosozonata HHB-11173 SS5]
MNHLNLGPFHDEVIAHIRKIIADPELLLALDSSACACLSGTLWHEPHVVYAVHELKPVLPDLRNALVVFLEGALDKWLTFTAEFAADGVIAPASSHQKALAFMDPTNDRNEGGLGTMRRAFARSSNITLSMHNSIEMYSKNNTEHYIRTDLSNDDRSWLRKAARTEDASGLAKRQRAEHVEATERQAAAGREKAEQARAKEQEKSDRLRTIKPILDLEFLQQAQSNERLLLCRNIDLQLEFFRQTDPQIPMKKLLRRRAEKLTALVSAVERYLARSEAQRRQGSHDLQDPQGEKNEERADFEFDGQPMTEETLDPELDMVLDV